MVVITYNPLGLALRSIKYSALAAVFTPDWRPAFPAPSAGKWRPGGKIRQNPPKIRKAAAGPTAAAYSAKPVDLVPATVGSMHH